MPKKKALPRTAIDDATSAFNGLGDYAAVFSANAPQLYNFMQKTAAALASVQTELQNAIAEAKAASQAAVQEAREAVSSGLGDVNSKLESLGRRVAALERTIPH